MAGKGAKVLGPRGRRICGRTAAAAAAALVRGCGAGGGVGRVWIGERAARTTWLDRGRWRRWRRPLWFGDLGTRSQSVGFLLDFRGFRETPGNRKVH
jgi:hypothetical protein